MNPSPAVSPRIDPAAAASPAAGSDARALHPVSTDPGTGAASPVHPWRCARWARAEGLRAGDAVLLLMCGAADIAALRLGLAQVGVRADALDLTHGEAALAGRLAGARLAVVDAALAGAYGRLLARVEARPAVWWNGPGADFARLDHALAEYDDAPLRAEELLGR